MQNLAVKTFPPRKTQCVVSRCQQRVCGNNNDNWDSKQLNCVIGHGYGILIAGLFKHASILPIVNEVLHAKFGKVVHEVMDKTHRH